MSRVLLTICRLVADAQFFESRLSKLEGAGDIGEHILNVVKNKEVVSVSSPATTAKVDLPERPSSGDRPNGVGNS